MDALTLRIGDLTAPYLEVIGQRVVRWNYSRSLLGASAVIAVIAASSVLSGPLIKIMYPVTIPDLPTVALAVADPAHIPPAVTTFSSDVALRRPTAPPRRTSVRAALPFTGALSIRSTPSGALVLVDQKPMGRTPLGVVRLRAGSHAIWIEHDGFQRWSAAVHVPADRRIQVAATLDPARDVGLDVRR